MADDWKILEAAFQRAIDLPEAEREAFLSTFALEHPELERQLRDLVAADGAGAGAIAAPLESLQPVTEDRWIGRAIGAWTITRRIGSGGMGAVFLAERSDRQYEQRVALKVMSAQLLASDAVARFKAERQILANLQHPYIAQLLDGGTTDDGLPYLVMEYVEGEPIDGHCDALSLGIEQRLRLFRRVCEAVDYAHRNLVVHRDLKPSNILVNAEGSPKLLDFGIAKLLEAGAYPHTMAMTRDGVRAMTPEYASPEQVRSEPISVASDVYALGVLLYRLMTGQSPYGSTLVTSRDYELAIVEVDPRRPSTVVTAADAAGASASRGLSPARLRKRLAGDLDNIALKALRKEPQRRYATASEMSADIGRYLAHEPVEARGDDWLYRARKYAVRNARGLGITAAVFATITTLVFYYTVQLADERDRANLAAAQSTEVSEFLTSLFESASPHKARGEQITAVNLLEQGRDRIEELEGQPSLQARLMRTMASSMTLLGHLDKSIPMLERTLEFRQQEEPRDELEISQVNHTLSEAYRQVGDFDKAEEHERLTIAFAEKEFGPTHMNVAYLTARLGVILFDAGKPDEALRLQRQALDQMIANGDGETSSAIDTRGNLANALAKLGRLHEAEALHRETIELSLRVDGELHPNTIIRTTNLGLVFTQLGEYDRAVALYTENLERAYKAWGPEYSHVEFIWKAMGDALQGLGRMEEAQDALEKAQNLAILLAGEESQRYAYRLRDDANLLLDLQRFEEAGKRLDAALQLTDRLQGPGSAATVAIRLHLGRLQARRGQLQRAEATLRSLLAEDVTLGFPKTAMLRRELADVLSRRGESDAAKGLIAEAIAAVEAAAGPDSGIVVPYLGTAAAIYRRAGDLDGALAFGERIVVTIDAGARAPLWQEALALIEHARTLRERNRAGAAPLLERALPVLRAAFGDGDARVIEAESLLAAGRRDEIPGV